MAAEGNSYNSQYYDLDRNIEETSFFSGFKDVFLVGAITAVIISVSSSFLVDITLNNYVDFKAKTPETKAIASNKLVDNFQHALEHNGLYNAANKITTFLSFSHGEKDYADKSLDRYIKDIVKFDNLKDLENQVAKLSEFKIKFMAENNINPDSKDGIILETKYQLQVDPILKEIEIVKNFNAKILEIKEQHKTNELTKG